MNVEAVKSAETAQSQVSRNFDLDSRQRRSTQDSVSSEQVEKKQIQPEEMLQQIKSLTEDGMYSVRFENDREIDELVVKVVDRETDEVIRQIPPEELMELTRRLNDLRGNIVDTEG
jgi:flagellar protein FlaG